MAIRDHMASSLVEVQTDKLEIDKLLHGLNRLPWAAQLKLIDGANRAAAQAARKIARRANYTYNDITGGLRKSIRVQSRRRNGRSYTNLIAGGTRPSSHAHLLHEGTEQRFTRERRGHGGGRNRFGISRGRGVVTRESLNRGRVKPREFLFRAFADHVGQVHAAVVKFARRRLDPVAAEARKGTGLKAK